MPAHPTGADRAYRRCQCGAWRIQYLPDKVTLMSRVEYVECRDRRILRLDYSGLSGAEVVAAMEQAMPVIAAEPPRSIRALTIWNTRLTNEIADAIKRYVAHNTPYIYASAIVTATPFQKVVF